MKVKSELFSNKTGKFEADLGKNRVDQMHQTVRGKCVVLSLGSFPFVEACVTKTKNNTSNLSNTHADTPFEKFQ